jgi:hypothetical protein
MSVLLIIALVLVGVGVGTVSGLVGIGGGVLVVPILMMAFGFEQMRANGTSLALLTMPVLALAVVRYHQAGQVAWTHAILIAVGYAGGAWIGAQLVTLGIIPREQLRVAFALLLTFVAASFLFRRGSTARVGLAEIGAVGFVAMAWLLASIVGRRVSKQSPRLNEFAKPSSTLPEYHI